MILKMGAVLSQFHSSFIQFFYYELETSVAKKINFTLRTTLLLFFLNVRSYIYIYIVAILLDAILHLAFKSLTYSELFLTVKWNRRYICLFLLSDSFPFLSRLSSVFPLNILLQTFMCIKHFGILGIKGEFPKAYY